MARAVKALFNGMVKLGNQRIIKTVDVIDNHRFLVLVELSPGGDFQNTQNLLECSQSPGRAIKALARSAIKALRSCMLLTICSSVNWTMCNFIVQHKFMGITPTTSPPCSSKRCRQPDPSGQCWPAIDNPKPRCGNMLGQFNGCVHGKWVLLPVREPQYKAISSMDWVVFDGRCFVVFSHFTILFIQFIFTLSFSLSLSRLNDFYDSLMHTFHTGILCKL